MNPQEAIEKVRRLAIQNRIRYTFHAEYDSMTDRSVSHRDVRHSLSNCEKCTKQEEYKWKCVGPDLEDDELTVVVVIEDDLLVVTVF
jgi:hypothetical protein